MARNYRVLQARMDPASRAENQRRVGQELQRMALDELRNAKRLTQAEMAGILDVPQSSISRIEQRADMYLSTLRKYVDAMGGVLQIQAVFPDGKTVNISRLGEYEDVSYQVWARAERPGTYRLDARPIGQGALLSTKSLKAPALMRTLRALHITDPQLSKIREAVESGKVTQLGGFAAARSFGMPDLVAAGFEERGAE